VKTGGVATEDGIEVVGVTEVEGVVVPPAGVVEPGVGVGATVTEAWPTGEPPAAAAAIAEASEEIQAAEI
jgi:hypothetical protein